MYKHTVYTVLYIIVYIVYSFVGSNALVHASGIRTSYSSNGEYTGYSIDSVQACDVVSPKEAAALRAGGNSSRTRIPFSVNGRGEQKETSINNVAKALSSIEKTDWKLTAGEVTSAINTTVVEARHDVVLSNGVIQLYADEIRYFTKTGWIYLRGNVILHFEDDVVITADEAELNVENMKGFMSNATIQLEDPFVRITGKFVERKGEKSYFFRSATVTSCNAKTPAWQFSARLVDVYIDGYTVLYDSAVQIYDFPTFTVPSLILPSNISRQTGFLSPEFSISTSKGISLGIPFYWAIDEQSDVLVSANLMSKKGLMLGTRYRGRYTQAQKVWLAGNWIYETNLEDLQSPVTKDTYTPNNNRYWIRGMVDTNVGESKWKFQADIDHASDLSFMSDYKTTRLGSTATLDETFDFFGRELNPLRQNRLTAGVFSRSYARAGLAVSARYEQDLLSEENAVITTDGIAVQHLPSVELFVYRQNIFEAIPSLAQYFPVEFESDLGATYFVRNSENHGLRGIFTPTFYIPIRTEYLSITPSAILHQRAYIGTSKSLAAGTAPMASNAYVLIPEYSIKAQSDISRAYSINTNVALTEEKPYTWAGIMHTIQPFISYTYRDDVNQESLPYYTLRDRLYAMNTATYGFTTSFVRKRIGIVQERDEETDIINTRIAQDYLRFLIFTAQQRYLFSTTGTEYQRNLLPMELSLKYYINNRFSLRSGTAIDIQTGDLVRADVTAEYWYDAWRFGFGYDFQEKAVEFYQLERVNSIYAEIETPVLYSMQLRGRYAHDIERNKPSEIWAELRYVDQCYSIGLRYEQDFFDTSIGFVFSIPYLF